MLYSFTGSAGLAAFRTPPGSTVDSVTVDAAAATFTVNGNGLITVSSPAVTASSALVVSIGGLGDAPGLDQPLFVGPTLAAPVINTNLFDGTTTGFLDVADARSFSLTIVAGAGISAGVLSFEGSLDGTNWFPVPVYNLATPLNLQVTTQTLAASTVYNFTGPVLSQFMRVRVSTAVVGGSVTAKLMLSEEAPAAPSAVQVAQQTAGNLNVTAGMPNPTALSINSAASTNATSWRNSATNLLTLCAYNAGATAAYVKLYNKATAPTVGTDVPVMVIAVPATGTVSLNLGTQGWRFATGVGLAITGGAADSDTTAVAAAQVKAIASY